MCNKIDIEFVKKVEEVAENININVLGSDPNSPEFTFQTTSPEGQDCNFSVTAKNADDLIDEVLNYWEAFDVSYETYLWLDGTGHGRNGAPYDMKDLYEDMAWWKDKIQELLSALKKAFAKER